jgi:phosphoribosylaminoimidazole carboxylase PurE protein
MAARSRKKKSKKKQRQSPAKAVSADAEASTEVDVRRPLVAVVMGSDSDFPVVQSGIETLEDFDIPYEVRVISAHRTPDKAHAFASTARLKGFKVLIAAAGGAAHLAGVMASLTTLPVIGIPIQTPTLGGADSLYSTVQMPAGVPVATVAIGKAGAKNAALLAAQILALNDDDLHDRLRAFRAAMRRTVAEKNERLRERLANPS